MRESEPARISVIFSLPPSNRRNEIIQLNCTANLKFDSKVDSPLTPQCQISWENSRFNYLDNNIQRINQARSIATENLFEASNQKGIVGVVPCKTVRRCAKMEAFVSLFI